MRTIPYLAAVLLTVAVAGCGSSKATSDGLYEFLQPSDPLAREKAVDVEVGKCMEAKGFGYHMIEFPSDPVAAGVVDSRARREKYGFGISTAGPTPQDVQVFWKADGTEPAGYRDQLTACGTEADNIVQGRQDARFATFSAQDRYLVGAVETADSVHAAWIAWATCMGRAEITTPALNSGELQADFEQRYKAGVTDVTLFQFQEREAAVADWDCAKKVHQAVKDFLEG